MDLNDPQTSALLFAVKRLMTGPEVADMDAQQFVGLSDEEVKATYAQACQMLQGGQPKPAAKLFALLVALKPSEGKHWRGLGLATHKAGWFQISVFLYSVALQKDQDDVISRVFLAEVLLKLHHGPRARKMAEQAVADGERLLPKQRDLAPYIKRAKKLIQFIQSSSEGAQSFEG